LRGKVARRFSTNVKRGRIVSQKPGAGVSVAAATKVDLVVSRGKRRR
jgi:beta-lactam-binding protein with PASTA domain